MRFILGARNERLVQFGVAPLRARGRKPIEGEVPVPDSVPDPSANPAKA